MSPDAAALLALLVYLAAACAVILRNAGRSAENYRVWLLYAIARTYTSLVFQLRLDRPCPLPADGAVLLIGNHRSPVDPMLIFATMGIRTDRLRIRYPEFLTASEYTDVGWPISFICRTLRTIPVDRKGRDMNGAKQALRRLEEGRLVGIFPEGRINKGEGLLPPIPGVGWLALKGRSPVFPVFVHNAPSAEGMIAPFVTRCRSRVVYGEPIDLSHFLDARLTAEQLLRVTSLLMDRLAETGGIDLHRLKVVSAEDPAGRASA